MKVTQVHIDVGARILIELDETEASALSGIFGYSDDAFLKAFYEKMGRAYVQPFEAGVRSLHARVRNQIDPELRKVDHARGKLRAP